MLSSVEGSVRNMMYGLQVMRHDVSLALGKAGPNVDVMCTDKRFGGRFMAFEKVRLKGSIPGPHHTK